MIETNATLSVRTRTLPPRDARGRFVARAGAAPDAPRVGSPLPRGERGRVRTLPSRDARGRFVAFPTTSAPRHPGGAPLRSLPPDHDSGEPGELSPGPALGLPQLELFDRQVGRDRSIRSDQG